ncbi:MAG: hypothetical protein IPO16_15090 [Saprospiraceae bacterium]|nr:hypothetical protein [Saprospiraceae bacterium]
MKWIEERGKLPRHYQEVLFYDIMGECLYNGLFDASRGCYIADMGLEVPIEEVLFWGAIPKYDHIVNDYI